MATPVISKSKESANLNRLLAKEKTSKPSQKHVLCPENVIWPRPSKQVEQSILIKLSETFKGLPNLFDSKKQNQADLDGKEKTERTEIRAQLQIGTSSVFRALERDELECVLVSGNATPAISVEHIVSLGRDMGCPLLVLDELAPSFAAATDSKCLPLTLGFKCLKEEQTPHFSELVSLIKEHAPVTQRKAVKQPPSLPIKSSQPSENSERQRPLRLNSSSENVILAELKRVFTSALVGCEIASKGGKNKKRKQKGKKNVKDPFDKSLHHQFEAGKQAVLGAVERSRLDVVLLSHEVEQVPATYKIMDSRSSSTCPPVVVLSGLTNTLKIMTNGACGLSFLGIKKLDLLPDGSKQDFKKVIELCNSALQNKSQLPTDSSQTKLSTSESSTDVDQENVKMEEGKVFERVRKKVEMEKEEEEDFSYLYILKKDSKDLQEYRSEFKKYFESSKADLSFSTDFISLSASKGKASSASSSVLNSNIKDKSSKKTSSLPKALDSSSGFISLSEKSAGRNTAEVMESSGETSGMDTGEGVSPAGKGNRIPDPAIGAISVDVNLEEKESISGSEKPTESVVAEETHNIQRKESDSEMISTKEMFFSINRGGDGPPPPSQGSAKPESKAFTTAAELFSVDRTADSHQNPKDSVNKGTVMLDTSVSEMFSIDRGGSGAKKQPACHRGAEVSTTARDESNILGTNDLKSTKQDEGMDYLAIDASVRSKQKAKAVKRKLDQQEGFISFAYTEANIKTMVSDPSKKRKKKKKK